jgi:3-oxoadipate enol-lactonase
MTEPNGVPVYIERGSGPITLVFLHGISGSKEVWQPQIDFFSARGYRTVAWDMPGYGASAMLPEYSLPALAAALSRVLDRTAGSRIVLVGHSMGGMVALEAAVRFPHRLFGMVLACTSPAFGKQEGAWQKAFIRARTRALDEGQTMGDIAHDLVPTLLGTEPDAQAATIAVEAMSQVPPATYRAAVAALTLFDRRAALPHIALPTLALAGAQDKTAPPDVLERMAQQMSRAQYVCLPKAGHLAYLEQPQAFNAAVLAFVEALARARK